MIIHEPSLCFAFCPFFVVFEKHSSSFVVDRGHVWKEERIKQNEKKKKSTRRKFSSSIDKPADFKFVVTIFAVFYDNKDRNP